jgi:plastocyanin
MTVHASRAFAPAALATATVLAACLSLAACDEPAITAATSTVVVRAPSAASAARQGEIPLIRFGANEHGSPFDPAEGHDRSSQAKDVLIPRTVVIPVGGQVEFEIDPFHRVNIYKAGTSPDDIDVSKLIDFSSGPVFIPKFVIDDPNNRIVQGPAFNFAIEQTWTTPVGTFNTPGRYLVMCSFLPHFAANDMYGWVIVQ